MDSLIHEASAQQLALVHFFLPQLIQQLHMRMLPAIPFGPRQHSLGSDQLVSPFGNLLHHSSPSGKDKDSPAPLVSSDGQVTSGDPNQNDEEPKKADSAKNDKINKAEHVFGKKNLEAHRLEKVLDFFGGDKLKAYESIEEAMKTYADYEKLGVQEFKVISGGQEVTVRATIVDGIARMSTAFITPP